MDTLTFLPIVNQTAIGELHVEGGRLIVGDLDIVAKTVAAWGGSRQLGRVVITIELLSLSNVDVNPSLGRFTEHSEP